MLCRCEAIGYYAQRLCMHTIRQPKTGYCKICRAFGLPALLFAHGAFVHEAGEVAWPMSKDSAPRAPFFPLDTPTAFANRARWMKARKVSVARQLHHPHEARAPVVVITDQQTTECRRRRVDYEVGERKPALVSDGGIDLALQTLDEFLPHVIR